MEEEAPKGKKGQRPLGAGPLWVPMYGAPPITRSIAQGLGEQWFKERAAMNFHPDIASSYRCVALLRGRSNQTLCFRVTPRLLLI